MSQICVAYTVQEQIRRFSVIRNSSQIFHATRVTVKQIKLSNSQVYSTLKNRSCMKNKNKCRMLSLIAIKIEKSEKYENFTNL